MAYFKPKNAVYNGQAANRMEQPFYLSWFQQQGELKRGGTAPHESRKAVEQQRMSLLPTAPQTIFKPPEPVQRQPQQRFKYTHQHPYVRNSPYIIQAQPKTIKNNLQEISKIYTASGQSRQFQQKRKSQELSCGKGRQEERAPQQQFPQYSRNNFNPTSLTMFQRTYTSSQQRNVMQADVRPVSQQQSSQVRQTNYQEDQQYQDRDIYEQCEEEQQNYFEEKGGIHKLESGIGCVMNNDLDNLSGIVDSDDGSVREDDEDELVHHDDEQSHHSGKHDEEVSNVSQGAESKRNSLSPREREQEQLANRSALQQQPVIESLRKNTNNMHRPMSSEGGRRKRNQMSHNDHQHQYCTQQQKDDKSRTTQNLALQHEDDQQIITPEAVVFNHFPDNPTIRVGGCYEIDDFDDIETFVVERHQTPTNRDMATRSGQRSKQSDIDIATTTDIAQQHQQLSVRPPSRHKIPPKAVGLEVPNIADLIDIPIKSMYANLDFDHSFEVNNKLNSNFTKKVTEQCAGDESEKRPTFTSDKASSFIYKGNQSSHNHPQSANTKYKGGFGMSFFPVGGQVHPLSSKAAQQSNTENFEIVIKHNTSSNFQKIPNQQPVKLPFQTSLGQDFLRLFANQHCTN